MSLGSIYTGIGLAQGLGGMPQAYAQGQQAAQQLAMGKLQQQVAQEQIQDSKISRQQTLKTMQQKEQERQDAVRRASLEQDFMLSMFGSQDEMPKDESTPTQELEGELPINALGATVDSTKTPIKPVKRKLSFLSMEPEVIEFNKYKTIVPKLLKTLTDPNVSEEEKQKAGRDLTHYGPQILKVAEGYRNFSFKKLARGVINLNPDTLGIIKPILQEMMPEVGDVVLEKTPAIDDRGNEVKGKFAYNLLSSIKDENGISVLVPLDKRLLTTMDDPEKIEDVLSKIESAKQQRINAFAVLEREARRYEKTDREYARKLEDERLSMAPTWRAITNDKGVVLGYEPILGMKGDLEEVEMERLRPKYSQLPKKDQDAAIQQDPAYIKFEKSLISNPRLNK